VKAWGLLALLAMTHYGYELFPNRWAAFAAGLGLTTAVLLWLQRGPRRAFLWPVSVWGAFEGAQVFACQMAQNWWEDKAGPFQGMCDVYTGVPLYMAGLSALAIIAYWGVRRG
jgi:hypothetical protein